MISYKKICALCVLLLFIGGIALSCGSVLPENEAAPLRQQVQQSVASFLLEPTATQPVPPTSTPTQTLRLEIGETELTPTAEVTFELEVQESTMSFAIDEFPSGSDLPLDSSIANLASKLEISEDDILIVSVKEVEWDDASLGCPEEGMMYATVITPGYLIVLEFAGKQYEYHTDTKDYVILCEAN